MKKIDLTQVKFPDVTGHETSIDIARNIGNILYMQGRDITESELGSKLFHSADALGDYNPQIGWRPKNGETRPDCSIELTAKEKEIIIRYVPMAYGYVVQKAVQTLLSD